MVVFATPAVAEPILWVVPKNATEYSGWDADELLNHTTIANVYMGLAFSENVLVLNHASAQAGNVAKDVNLTFFVYNADNINDITIGKAKRIQPQIAPHPNVTDNINASVAQTLTFHDVGRWKKVPPGFAVNYTIGDIPWHGNQDDVGNPQTNLGSFNPDVADVYIEIPFTINFEDPPAAGFILYVYADNYLGGGDDWAHTAWSHDCGYYQVPEFTTIAIPVAAVLGLLFFFNHRKHRRND